MTSRRQVGRKFEEVVVVAMADHYVNCVAFDGDRCSGYPTGDGNRGARIFMQWRCKSLSRCGGDPIGFEHLHDALQRDIVGVVQFVADVVVAGLYAEFAGADPQR